MLCINKILKLLTVPYDIKIFPAIRTYISSIYIACRVVSQKLVDLQGMWVASICNLQWISNSPHSKADTWYVSEIKCGYYVGIISSVDITVAVRSGSELRMWMRMSWLTVTVVVC